MKPSVKQIIMINSLYISGLIWSVVMLAKLTGRI